MVMTDWSRQTVLAAEPGSASLARDFVYMHLAAHGLQYLVEDVRLVVSELATNAVTHAQTPFSLTLSRVNGWVLLDVMDGAASAAPVPFSPDLLDEHGRGLLLVEVLTREWGTSTTTEGRKSVWASFPCEPRAPARRAASTIGPLSR